MMAKLKQAKREPPQNQNIEPELLAEINSEQVGGQSHEFCDNAFWQNLTPASADWAWLAALEQLDRLSDEKPLQQLLKVCDPSPKIEKYLVDLIDRRVARVRAKKGHGRPRTPAYALSRNDALLLIADGCVRAYIQRGDSKKVALDKVRDEWAWVPLNRSTLAAVYNGCHASLNRHRKRL
jgi:hypothetical protein